MEFRVGQGTDIHQLVPERKLILGGVEIPYHLGLLGHSDADALLHAITDALLGAAGMGDIGQMFPDSDPKWKDANSLFFLEYVYNEIKKVNWQVINVDCTLLLQAPKIASYKPAMQVKIADVLDIESNRVSIKATTTEHLGFVGREQGLVASCTLLIMRD